MARLLCAGCGNTPTPEPGNPSKCACGYDATWTGPSHTLRDDGEEYVYEPISEEVHAQLSKAFHDAMDDMFPRGTGLFKVGWKE